MSPVGHCWSGNVYHWLPFPSSAGWQLVLRSEPQQCLQSAEGRARLQQFWLRRLSRFSMHAASLVRLGAQRVAQHRLLSTPLRTSDCLCCLVLALRLPLALPPGLRG